MASTHSLSVDRGKEKNLRRRIVVVGVERVDRDNDFGDGTRRVGGRGAEGARDERRALHQPHCSLRFRRVHVSIVRLFRATTTTLVFHSQEKGKKKKTKKKKASLQVSFDF